MEKTWKITIEAEEPETGNEQAIIFFDSQEIIGKATLNKRFVDDLKWNFKNKQHYKIMRNVKNVKSSAGDKLAINSVGIILATVANEDIKSGFLFTKTDKGGYEIIALWPEDFARACKASIEIYRRMIVSIVQNPALFQEVSIVLP